VFDKTLNQLRALGIEVPKTDDEPKADAEEAKNEKTGDEDEQITESQT